MKKAQEELTKNYFKSDRPTPKKAPAPVKVINKKSDQKSYEITGALAEDLKAAGFITVTKNSFERHDTIATYYPNNFEEFNLMLDKLKQAWTNRQIVKGVNNQFEELGKGVHEYQTGIKKKAQVKEPEIKLKVTENGVQADGQLSSEDSESETDDASEPEAEKGPEIPGVPTITIVNPKKIVESEKMKEECEITNKRGGDPENWQKNIKKRKRQAGQEYTDVKGNLVPAKSMLPPCSDQCILNCSKKIAEDARKELFDHFWTLTTYEKRFYCADRVKEIEKKFHTKRMVTRVYHLESGGIWYRVCKNFFCSTLGYQNIDQLLRKKRTTGSLDPLEGN